MYEYEREIVRKMEKLTLNQLNSIKEHTQALLLTRCVGKQITIQMINELFQYKQIEEELEVDLITLVNEYVKWQPLEKYESKHSWVLLLCKDKKDGHLYEIPYIAKLRKDNKWYDKNGVCLNDYLDIIVWKPIYIICEDGGR